MCSVYCGCIRDLPVGTDLLPYLIYSGDYIDCIQYARKCIRCEVVIYLYEPQWE